MSARDVMMARRTKSVPVPNTPLDSTASKSFASSSLSPNRSTIDHTKECEFHSDSQENGGNVHQDSNKSNLLDVPSSTKALSSTQWKVRPSSGYRASRKPKLTLDVSNIANIPPYKSQMETKSTKGTVQRETDRKLQRENYSGDQATFEEDSSPKNPTPQTKTLKRISSGGRKFEKLPPEQAQKLLLHSRHPFGPLHSPERRASSPSSYHRDCIQNSSHVKRTTEQAPSSIHAYNNIITSPPSPTAKNVPTHINMQKTDCRPAEPDTFHAMTKVSEQQQWSNSTQEITFEVTPAECSAETCSNTYRAPEVATISISHQEDFPLTPKRPPFARSFSSSPVVSPKQTRKQRNNSAVHISPRPFISSTSTSSQSQSGLVQVKPENRKVIGKTYEEWLLEKLQTEKRRQSDSTLHIQTRKNSLHPEGHDSLRRRKSYDQWLEEKENQINKSKSVRRKMSKQDELDLQRKRKELNEQKYLKWLQKKHEDELKEEEKIRQQAQAEWEKKQQRTNARHLFKSRSNR